MTDIPKRPRGRPKGSRNKVSKAGRTFATRIVNDAKYRERLLSQARLGQLAPAVQTALMAYAWGKPVDQVELETNQPNASALGPITIVINGKTYRSGQHGVSGDQSS